MGKFKLEEFLFAVAGVGLIFGLGMTGFLILDGTHEVKERAAEYLDINENAIVKYTKDKQDFIVSFKDSKGGITQAVIPKEKLEDE